MKVAAYLEERAALVARALERVGAAGATRAEQRLREAMDYALLLGGKRIRPILVLAASESVGGAVEPALPFACAVEMVHTYSLVHDDLPAMDDDDLRRGRPSSHKVFGEAVAILAGDGLLTDAFAVMSRELDGGPTAERALAAVRELAVAAGSEGMVGGQAADILAEGAQVDLARMESIHSRKTGALLRGSVRIGAILGGASEPELADLTRYGETLGLAFQVADDLLDETGNTAATGKAARRDRERGKSTYPALLGIERSRELLRELLDRALVSIERFDERAQPLREIVRFVVIRAL